ncbi:hypothetical protein AHMF7616_01336 [Adhaeribacter pallidiroseus]|uniref:Uncharacterized protein n=1 Tax=Adhaeribacter pallidiroseus TaxID=2072847 RepID=A0A369QE89_9BACT|nr:hypothetical protein AHMF7616_01336 [Adhaeribacter pallidiroseus]
MMRSIHKNVSGLNLSYTTLMLAINLEVIRGSLGQGHK